MRPVLLFALAFASPSLAQDLQFLAPDGGTITMSAHNCPEDMNCIPALSASDRLLMVPDWALPMLDQPVLDDRQTGFLLGLSTGIIHDDCETCDCCLIAPPMGAATAYSGPQFQFLDIPGKGP